MMLISTIKSRVLEPYKHERIEWVMEIFRNFSSRDPASISSANLKLTHEYKWFNLYKMKDFKFQQENDIELYVSKDLFDKGNYHEVYLSVQRRRFHKVG